MKYADCFMSINVAFAVQVLITDQNPELGLPVTLPLIFVSVTNSGVASCTCQSNVLRPFTSTPQTQSEIGKRNDR